MADMQLSDWIMSQAVAPFLRGPMQLGAFGSNPAPDGDLTSELDTVRQRLLLTGPASSPVMNANSISFQLPPGTVVSHLATFMASGEMIFSHELKDELGNPAPVTVGESGQLYFGPGSIVLG